MNQHQKRTQADKKKLRPPRPLLIVLQDLDFTWEQEEVNAFITLYNMGCSTEHIAKKLRPHLAAKDAQDEVELLAMHLHRKNRI